MAYEEKVLNINEVNLDQNNPRFNSVDNQREAIHAMLNDQGSKIVSLAADIFENGLNPSARSIVFREKEKYIDGDGNRRLTAIKILQTPDLAKEFPHIKKKISSILKRKGKVPVELPCVVFPNRNDAKHWIGINHGGEQEGRGQINWSAEQKDRFEQKPSVGLCALDLLLKKNLISQDDRSEINKSTLDRLLGFRVTKEELSIRKDGPGFEFGDVKQLQKVVLALKGKSVGEVYTAQEGRAFVERALMDVPQNDVANEGLSSTLQAESTVPTHPVKLPRSPRVKYRGLSAFGGALSLENGHVNNLYRDIEYIYKCYMDEEHKFSEDFIVIFRMSLRMLAETAAKSRGTTLGPFLQDNYAAAKSKLDQNTKTTLSNQSINEDSIVKLFQTGAHDYHNSRNKEQALGLSIILGEILKLTHGKGS